MSNAFGGNQAANAQQTGTNITGVSAGDGPQNNAQAMQRAGQAAGAGLTASTAGTASATNAAGITAATNAAGTQANNVQVAGSNITGVSAGDGPQNDAQSMQRAGQQPLG